MNKTNGNSASSGAVLKREIVQSINLHRIDLKRIRVVFLRRLDPGKLVALQGMN